MAVNPGAIWNSWMFVIKARSGRKMRLLRYCKLGVLLLLLGLPIAASAQGFLSRPQTGTVQALAQDDGFITVSGRNIPFDDEVTTVMLAGVKIDSATLDEGMVIRYTLNSRGFLLTIEIIGPASKLEILNQN
jgi:hypothetical protein